MRSIQSLLTAAAIMALSAGTASPQQAAESVDGLAAWSTIYAVFSHPRCTNCHVADDRPRWSGAHYGVTRVHGFNVQRGADGSGFGNPGLRCTTCHFSSNSSMLHGPPGAEEWRLAPVEMAWWQKSSAEICAQIKDSERNGGRTLAAIAIHVRDVPLVGWGWHPGPGREPPPGSPEQTYRAIEDWVAAGAPCPSH